MGFAVCDTGLPAAAFGPVQTFCAALGPPSARRPGRAG